MSFGERMTTGGGIKGLLMMAGAAIWFFVGLAAGYIYFYPPVMFVIGLVMFGNAVFGDEPVG